MKWIQLLLGAFLVIAQPCLSQEAGTKLWEVATPGEIVSSPAIAPDGTIYVGSGGINTSGSFCSFTPQGGTNWILDFPKYVRSSPSIGPDGRVYVGCYNGELLIVSPTGTYTKFATGGYIIASPAIGADGTVYVGAISNWFNKFFALTPDGSVKWVFAMKPMAYNGPVSKQSSSPAIGPDGTIYVGSIDRNLYAINPDGTTNWILPLLSITNNLPYPTMASPAIGSDGTIYIGADTGVFYAVDPKGVFKWRFQAAPLVESSAAVDTDGTIYFGSTSGQFYALASDGSLKWQRTLSGVSSSAALGSGGVVIIGCYGNSRLYALDSSGTNLWSFTAPGYIWSSPAIGADGTIYIGIGNKLYAVAGTNALMRTSWPMFRGDVTHPARSIQRAIQKPSILSDGSVSMDLKVEPGRGYQVEYSTNLVDWAELTNFVSQTFTNQVIDGTATNSPKRFYRLSTLWP